MFKKIILILIFSLVPTNSYASDIFFDNWTEKDFIAIVPDQYTINLASMYTKIDRYIKDFEQTVSISYLNGFDKNIYEKVKSSGNNGVAFFNLKNVDITLVNENKEQIEYFNKKFKNTRIANYFKKDCNVEINIMCGGADPFENRNTPYIWLYFNSKFNGSDQDYTGGVYHDLAHIYAFDLVYPNTNLNNCWIWEGMANALGFAAMAHFEEVEDQRINQIMTLKNFPIKISYQNKQKIIETFKKEQNNPEYCWKNNILMGYGMGMLIIEYLYINYEVEQVHNFLKYWGLNQTSMSDALKNSLMVDEDIFFDKSFNYVIESYQRALTSKN